MTMTLDGYVAGPNNELDWMTKTLMTDSEEVQDNLEHLKSFNTGIMGYPTFVGMNAYWKLIAQDPKSSDNERNIANIITEYYAYVLSNKDESLSTENSELILYKDDSDIVNAVKTIKKRVGNRIGIAGGVRTAQTLSKLGLIDEYLLTIHPVVIGSGKPLFITKTNLNLDELKTYKNGIIRSRYEVNNSTNAKLFNFG